MLEMGRRELALGSQEALAEFRTDKLKAQTADEVIAELNWFP
jgi:hypothetical protein